MSDTNRTTPMPDGATPDTITITRPTDVKPAAWEYRATMVHLAMTGHYPWCSRHEDDPEGGWCNYDETWSGVGTVGLSNGTTDGSIHVTIDFDPSLNLDELGLAVATRVGALIDKVCLVGRAYNAPQERDQ